MSESFWFCSRGHAFTHDAPRHDPPECCPWCGCHHIRVVSKAVYDLFTETHTAWDDHQLNSQLPMGTYGEFVWSIAGPRCDLIKELFK